MSDLLPYQPSLASATNTRLDTSCKHHQQCRVSTDDMLLYTEIPMDQEELQRHKYRYCIHKDEFVIGLGRPWVPDKSRKRVNNAYPRVISNLGQLSMDNKGKVALKMIKYMNHYARSVSEKEAIIQWFMDKNACQDPADEYGQPLDDKFMAFTEEEKEAAHDHWIRIMCDQIPVGFSQTLGWAHPNSCDTMVTVMIGGLRTVMNGDFEVFPGDLIQWYWPFERDCFKHDGRRNDYVSAWQLGTDGMKIPPNVMPEFVSDVASANTVRLDGSATAREKFHTRGYGNISEKQSKLVARVKPFFRDDDNPRIYDSYRVFAIAIAAARPHEMLDIKISKQSV
jgi:hypothetical protein